MLLSGLLLSQNQFRSEPGIGTFMKTFFFTTTYFSFFYNLNLVKPKFFITLSAVTRFTEVMM